MNDARPAPLVPRTVDLRNFPDMPVEVARVRGSELRRRSSGDEFKAAMLLWFAAWHEVPAGSLPTDDVELADMAAFGTGKAALRAWAKVKAQALRGWVWCSDDRYHHPIMAEKALRAWKSKLDQKARTAKARLASLAKALEKETSPITRLSLQTEHDRLSLELSQAIAPASAPPVTGDVAASKGSDRIGSDRSGGSAQERDPTPHPPAEAQEHHLAAALRSLGLGCDAAAIAEWVDFLAGPLVRSTEPEEQVRALRWMVTKLLAQHPGTVVRYARHVQAMGPAWREFNRPKAPAPTPAPEKPRESQEDAKARRLRGELQDWELSAIDPNSKYPWHVAEDGSLVRGPKPIPEPVGAPT